MKYKIIEFNSIKTAGLAVKITRSHSENYSIIREVWKKFNHKLYKVRNSQSYSGWVKYGVTYKNDGEYYYLSSINQNDLVVKPDDFVVKEIIGGKYICFTHQGGMNQIKNTVNLIYKKIIPDNNIDIKIPEKDGLIHFEKYDKRFNWNNGDSKIDIIVPLK